MSQIKVLIVDCHPSKNSYTFEIFTQLKETLDANSIDYVVSDLYEMNFLSDMSESEYEREGLGNRTLPLPADIVKEQYKLKCADCVIFVYPVWWSDCPSKLKGWFDRVYTLGYAYGYNKKFDQDKMNKIKYGLVVCTAGHPNFFLEEIGIAKSMRNVMLDDRLGERFENKEMILLGGTLDIENVRVKHSLEINSLSEKILANCTQ